MTSIAKKIVVNEQGKPLEVIIAWDVYQDLAERMGWDLSDAERADVHAAAANWRKGKRAAFVSLADVK
jgi:hypothetical protein